MMASSSRTVRAAPIFIESLGRGLALAPQTGEGDRVAPASPPPRAQQAGGPSGARATARMEARAPALRLHHAGSGRLDGGGRPAIHL